MPFMNSNCWKTPDDSTIIMRYMSWEKFESLVTRRQMYFNEVLKYREVDPKEGEIPTSNRVSIDNQYFTLSKEGGQTINIGVNYESKRQVVNFMQHLTCINCWNMAEEESLRMWREYAPSDKDVLVVSTIGAIKKAFEKTQLDVYIGKIKYVDHLSYVEGSPNPLTYCFLKDRETYDWENEVRLMVFDSGIDSEIQRILRDVDTPEQFLKVDFTKVKGVDHVWVDINVSDLISLVILSPWAKPSYYETVEKIMVSNGIDAFVKQSNLCTYRI